MFSKLHVVVLALLSSPACFIILIFIIPPNLNDSVMPAYARFPHTYTTLPCSPDIPRHLTYSKSCTSSPFILLILLFFETTRDMPIYFFLGSVVVLYFCNFVFFRIFVRHMLGVIFIVLVIPLNILLVLFASPNSNFEKCKLLHMHIYAQNKYNHVELVL